MDSLLNKDRPPVFCPGCSHDPTIKALDRAFRNMGLEGSQVAIVSDIGCSGLIDVFFNTHALHGLHGRALTYATGLKMARPELAVVVTMGDGGLGIGGAHFLAACRRNLDITLLVLNNFNFGMTGGQSSVTTPPEARVGSGFLNRLEMPMDVCKLAAAGGAPYVVRSSAYDRSLADKIEEAIRYDGFSVVDIQGICTGRYALKNPINPKMIEDSIKKFSPLQGEVAENVRNEYGRSYRQMAATQAVSDFPSKIAREFDPLCEKRKEVLLLGCAGQRMVTAGELLCLAAMTSGLFATQKSEYNITVLRGPSISEVIVSPLPVGFTGIMKPSVVIMLDRQGVESRKDLFRAIDENGVIICAKGLEIPEMIGFHKKSILEVDFKKYGLKPMDWALASLSVLARQENGIISYDMLKKAVAYRFKDHLPGAAMEIIGRDYKEAV